MLPGSTPPTKPRAHGKAGRPPLSESIIATYRAVIKRWIPAKASGIKKAAFTLDPQNAMLDAAMAWQRGERAKTRREKTRQAIA
jgi:hypothetical protein